MPAHQLNGELLTRAVRVRVIGAGGTGSSVMYALVRQHKAMLAWGHPAGLEVTLQDGDTISTSNLVRTPFTEAEVGLRKATVLVGRINAFAGLRWKAETRRFGPRDTLGGDDVVIGCVDTRAARRTIETAARRAATVSYLLDFGNSADSGQFVLGQPANPVNAGAELRLPTAAELFPEITDRRLDGDDQPSCSAAEALDRQHPFINETLATLGLAMLCRLFRYGRIAHHGGVVNLADGVCSEIPVDPAVWAEIRGSSGMDDHPVRTGAS
jgi:PRTRC genetic system ThiF family protein